MFKIHIIANTEFLLDQSFRCQSTSSTCGIVLLSVEKAVMPGFSVSDFHAALSGRVWEIEERTKGALIFLLMELVESGRMQR
jgi:hypothetical protein